MIFRGFFLFVGLSEGCDSDRQKERYNQANIQANIEDAIGLIYLFKPADDLQFLTDGGLSGKASVIATAAPMPELKAIIKTWLKSR